MISQNVVIITADEQKEREDAAFQRRVKRGAFPPEKEATKKALVDKFLSWPLPKTVCSDRCATDRDYKLPRSGTNLLSADEAAQMIEHLFDL